VSRPINFLHITTFYPPYSFGGDAIFVDRLACALADAGHQVDVVHCIDSYRLLHAAEPEGERRERPNLRVHGLSSGYGLLSPLLSHQAGRPYFKRSRIQQILNASRPDVIHYHNISLLGPGVLALRRDDAEAIKLYTMHEHWLICPTHVLWKFGRRPCEKPECIRCTIAAGRPPQIWRYTGLLERSVREVDQFLAPSRFTAEIHAQRGFSQPMLQFPLFAERSDRDWLEPSSRPHERRYFLFAGRLETVKGVRSLIEAWHKTADVDLLIAGNGSQESELRALAASNPRISFLGRLPERALGPLYAHCIACVVPSLTYEIFPNVLLEAFARKAPVVARDLGPLSEVIATSGGGLLFRDEQELLAALARIATRPSLRSELGENGYRSFTENWTTEAHLKRYFGLLCDIALRKFGRVPWEVEDERASLPE
jgi:glycosyltransferase involved in cell wall biosynthesis